MTIIESILVASIIMLCASLLTLLIIIFIAVCGEFLLGHSPDDLISFYTTILISAWGVSIILLSIWYLINLF